MQAKRITEFINAVRELSGVGICYYDLESFFNYGVDGVKNNRGHYCELCERTRALSGGRAYCQHSDREEAVALARMYKEPFFFECHMGMRELIVPIIRLDSLIGIIFVGQCRIEGEDMTLTVRQSAERLGGSPDNFAELYSALPLVDRNLLLNTGKLLSEYYEAMITKSETLNFNGDDEKPPALLAERIKNYLDQEYIRGAKLSRVAARFFVNPSYASRTFSRQYGVSIVDYVNRLKIDRAKLLLSTTDIPLGSIALNVGFSDANYFSRLFKKNVGISPREYRSKKR